MANEENKVKGNDTKKVEKVEHKNVYAALSAFHGGVSSIKKDAHVNFKAKSTENVVDFWYATLGLTFDEVNPILSKHGLSVHHEISDSGDSLEAFLIHETSEVKREVEAEETSGDGETKVVKKTYCNTQTNVIRSGKLKLDLTQSDMKDVGGQLTYGRRYTLCLILGIATDDDKDTQLIEEKKKKSGNFVYKKTLEGIKKAEGEDLEKQLDFLKDELKKTEDGKVPSLGLDAEQYENLIALAEKKTVDANK